MFKGIINFLHPKNHFQKGNRKWKKVLWYSGYILGGLLLFLAVFAVVYWQPTRSLIKTATAGKEDFKKAQDLLLAQDFSGAQTTLESAVVNFQETQKTFTKFLWLKKLPWARTQVEALENLLAAGVTTGQSIQKVAAVASAVAKPLTKNKDVSLATLSAKEKNQVLESIYNAKPALEEAKQSIDKAVAFVDAIPSDGLLKKISDVVVPLKEQVPQLQTGLDQAISVSRILPVVAGYPDKKTYLFLLQNNAELRPTGGFIGTYGILKIKDGEIASFVTDNTYNLDTPAKAWLSVAQPWPMTRYNDNSKWFLRNANWSPDFPTTAEKALWFYRQERGPERNIDGTIAITPTFIQSLLTLTGNVKVNGLTFTPENFIDTLQDQVERGFLRQNLPASQRKEIIGVLSKKILDDVLALPKSSWPKLWKIIQQDISQKQILINVKDEYTQELILKENWGGQIQPVDHDYIAVIDANLASLKSDPVVKRSLTYTVSKDGDNLVADLAFTYKNEGTFTWKTTRYRTYVRVYVPAGSRLVKSEGATYACKSSKPGVVETTEELQKTVFGTFVCTEPGETRTLRLRYVLPARIAEQLAADRYQILIQKQPGTATIPVTYSIDVKRKIQLTSGFSSTAAVGKDKLSLKQELSQDQLFDIQFQ